MAVGAGVWINIDALDEVDMIEAAVGETGGVANVGVRRKLDIIALRGRQVGSTNLADRGLANKWGLPLDQAVAVVRRVRDNPSFALKGLSYHLGRHTHEASDFMEMARDDPLCRRDPCRDRVDDTLHRPRRRLGLRPSREDRPALARTTQRPPPSSNMPRQLRCVEGRMPERWDASAGPEARARSRLTSSIGLLGRVGVVKKWPGFKNWINVDTSSNHVSRIELKGWYHHIVCANRATEVCTERADIVGPLCSVDC